MAGLLVRVPFGPVQLVSGAVKTLVTITAPSNQRLRIVNWYVGFDGTSVTDPHIELRAQHYAGAGTGGTAITPKVVGAEPETPRSTAQQGPSTGTWAATGGGTGVDPASVSSPVQLMTADVAPYSNFIMAKPEMVGGGIIWGLDAKPGSNTPNARGWVEYEE